MTARDLYPETTAVGPLDESYPGCPYDSDGLCAYDNVLQILRARAKEIDYNYACFGN